MKISNIIAVCATIICLGSAIVSVRSCQIANQSLTFAEQNYNDLSKIALLSTKVSKDIIFLKPASGSHILQEAKIWLPPQLKHLLNYRFTQKPEHSFRVQSIREALNSFLLEDFLEIEDNALMIPDTPEAFEIPVIIESTYLFRGEVLKDTSLYSIYFSLMFGNTEEREGQFDTELKGFQFIERYENEQDKVQFLESKLDAIFQKD